MFLMIMGCSTATTSLGVICKMGAEETPSILQSRERLEERA
jgi:hypothetical protein